MYIHKIYNNEYIYIYIHIYLYMEHDEDHFRHLLL